MVTRESKKEVVKGEGEVMEMVLNQCTTDYPDQPLDPNQASQGYFKIISTILAQIINDETSKTSSFCPSTEIFYLLSLQS